MTSQTKDSKEKLLQLMRDVMNSDVELREKFQIGEKFRFIRDRLQALQNRVEENVKTIKTEVEKVEKKLAEDEALVYVYLYNTQGMVLQSWQKMLNPAVFYEYSVNRPIYAEKTYVDIFIRNKSNKTQHAFLTIAVKKTDILPTTESLKDAFSSPLARVREGSLNFNKLISFTHAGNEYIVNEEGALEKKI